MDIPRRDGTGPLGMRPMTGRGAGFCFGRSTNNFLNKLDTWITRNNPVCNEK